MNHEPIIKAAKAAGLTIHSRPGVTYITKGKTLKSIGVALWPDGSANRSDVQLDQALNIRSAKEVRGILGIQN